MVATIELTCDMTGDCEAEVSYIDEKGFAYCTEHGRERQQSKRCRKLRAHELRRLRRGEQVERY